MSLQQQVQDYIAQAQESVKKVPDQLKAGKVQLQELFFLVTAYLGMRCSRLCSLLRYADSSLSGGAVWTSPCTGGFGLIGFLLPSLGTTAYGGDGHPGMT